VNTPLTRPGKARVLKGSSQFWLWVAGYIRK